MSAEIAAVMGISMTRKLIVIENRNPRNADERALYGQTITEGQTVDIFINSKKNRSGNELVDTLFHELCHAAVGLYRTKLTPRREEKLARLVGNIVRDAFKGA